MNVRLGRYRLLWQAALHQFPQRGMLLVTVLTTVLCIGLMASSVDAGGLAWLGWILCTPASFLLMIWAMAYLPGAQSLNTPANAQLVPGMRARLIELTLLVWLAGIGMLAAGLYLVFGAAAAAAGSWIALCTTLGVALGMSGSLAGGVLFLPLLMHAIGRDGVPAALLVAASSPVVVTALVPALGALAVLWLFPRSGVRIQEMAEHRARMVGANPGLIADRDPRPYSPDGWLLRRAVARRDPRALLLPALGRNVVCATALSVAGTILVLGALITVEQQGLLTTTLGGGVLMTSWGLISSSLLVFLFHPGTTPVWLASTTGEQALVRLAPAFPATPARFNALLARAQLRQAFMVWAIACAGSILLALAVGWRGDALLRQVGICCLILPALPLCLRDHARNNAWHFSVMWAVAIGLSYFGALVGLGAHLLIGLPFWPVALATALAMTVVLSIRRLRLMRAAPFALPAGRLD